MFPLFTSPPVVSQYMNKGICQIFVVTNKNNFEVMSESNELRFKINLKPIS